MDELISKRALIEYYCKRDCGMTREECTIGDCHEIGLIEEFQPVLGTNLAEVGTDVHDINVGELISRQAAIDALDRRFDSIPMEQTSEILLLRKDLREMPPIQPKPKSGRWILDRSGAYCCSECMEPCATYVMMQPRDKYCKMCGAKMEVTE